MPNIGPMELIIVLVIALLILGPKRLGYAAGISCHGTQMNDYLSELEGVSAPVCIIWGDKDHAAPPPVQEAYEGGGAAGLTPLRPSPAVDKMLAENPFWKPFVDGIAFGGPEPLLTDYKGFQNVMIEMVQSVVTGAAEPKDALTKAAGALEEYK